MQQMRRSFIQPAEGNKFIRIYFSITNNNSTDRMITPFEFKCYADNMQMDQSIYGDETLSTATISSGRSAQGYIYYEVPKDAQSIEIEYETNWWTDKKAIFKVK